MIPNLLVHSVSVKPNEKALNCKFKLNFMEKSKSLTIKEAARKEEKEDEDQYCCSSHDKT